VDAAKSRATYNGATVAAHDIARLADVGRAAVSNWRRRFPDFPQPVGGTSASPLYSLAEVEEWLTRHGKHFQLLPGDRIWQQMRGVVDDLRLGELIGYLGAFLVFLRRKPGAWRTLARRGDEAVAAALTDAVTRAVPELPDPSTQELDGAWVPIIRQAADAARGQGHKELFDYLCERYLEAHSRRYSVTPAEVAELMVELADPAGGVVLDPACGTGTLLLAGHARGASVLLGQDSNPTIALLAAARLLLHDSSARVAAGDSLRSDAFSGERADVVLCNPPFNERSWGYEELTSDPRWEYGLPPRGEPELAWAQHCLAHVDPGGRVAILMPASAASRRAGRRIRGNLLRAGALRAVISLPGGGPGSAAPDLWILHRPEPGEPAPSHVLMVDAAADLDGAVEAWRAFRDDPQGPMPAASRSVRIIDLLDEEVDLSPARHLAVAAAGEASAFPSAREALLSTAADLAATLPDLAAVADQEPLPMTTLGELVKAGVVVVHQAPVKMTTDSGDTPVLTAKDVRLGRSPSGRSPAGPGSVTVQPGDVVVPVASEHPVARVVTEGGALLGPQLVLFRVDPDRFDPYFLAGFLRAAQTTGAVRSFVQMRTDQRRTPIPRLPLDRQRDFGEAFRRLIVFEDQARHTASLAEKLVRLGFAGLADGTLRPRSGVAAHD